MSETREVTLSGTVKARIGKYGTVELWWYNCSGEKEFTLSAFEAKELAKVLCPSEVQEVITEATIDKALASGVSSLSLDELIENISQYLNPDAPEDREDNRSIRALALLNYSKYALGKANTTIATLIKTLEYSNRKIKQAQEDCSKRGMTIARARLGCALVRSTEVITNARKETL